MLSISIPFQTGMDANRGQCQRSAPALLTRTFALVEVTCSHPALITISNHAERVVARFPSLQDVTAFLLLRRPPPPLQVGYTSYPDNVVREFVRESRACGVDIFRVFDSLNYVDNLLFGLDTVHAAGGIAEGTLCYTGDLSDPKRDKVQRRHICLLP